MMNSYSAFAKVYDALTSNIDYKQRAHYFDSLIQRHGGTKNILLDLACGTGSLSCAFSYLGYDVIAIDQSCEMLSIAQEKTIMQNLDIAYINQSIQDMDLYGSVDVTVCALDSINHITDMGTLQKAFDRVSFFLDEKGLFIFDVNTLYKHKKIIGNNTFVYDLDDIYCVWQNTLEDNCQISIHLDIFTGDGQTYIREEEDFAERAYTKEELASVLKNAGLQIFAIYDEDSFEPVHELSERVIYVTGKV